MAYGVFLPDSSLYIYQCPVLALQLTIQVWNLGALQDNLNVVSGRVGEELDLTGLSFLDLQVDFVRIGPLLMFSGA